MNEKILEKLLGRCFEGVEDSDNEIIGFYLTGFFWVYLITLVLSIGNM